MKHNVTLSFDPDIYSRYRVKVGNVSKSLEDSMRQSLDAADREGLQVTQEEYEHLLRLQEDLSKDADKRVERLQKQGVYDSLANVASEVGIDFEGFENLDELIPELYKHWDRARDYMIRYIAWLEILKAKRKLEQRIFTIQNAKLKAVGPSIAVANEAIRCSSVS